MHANNRPIDTNLLSATELHALDSRIAANAYRWLIKQIPTFEEPRKQKSTRGPKPDSIANPFYGFIGRDTRWGRYPRFAMDIIEGIARLEWHNRSIDSGGKSTPLSVRNLVKILETLPFFHNEAIEDFLQLKPRHARRYFKAVKLIIPWMMKRRPSSLTHEMNGTFPEVAALPIIQTHDWEDCDDASTPDTEVLAKLNYDLRTLTQFKSADEYEAEYEAELNIDFVQPTIAQAPGRLNHPMKAKVMQMLRDGAKVKPIARETGVDPKTIRKWRDKASELDTSLAA
jgi:hypothetical protein